MSERGKELVWMVVSFTVAILFGLYMVLGKVAFGAMSLPETKEFCAFCSFGCVAGGIISLIGNRRLNDWINPRLEAHSKRKMEARERRKAMRLKLDLEDPSRVTRRNTRKQSLRCMAGWCLLLGPLVAIIASATLSICFKTETYYAVLAISIFFAVQVWGIMLKEFLQMRKEDKQND